MRGESNRNYAARMEGLRNKRQVNQDWERLHVPDSTAVPVACTCAFRPWPHVVQELPAAERERHNDPRHFNFERGQHCFSPVRRWRQASAEIPLHSAEASREAA